MSTAQLSRLAVQDIDSIAAYIAADRRDAALRFYDAVAEAIDMLASMPNLGQAFSHPKFAGLRCQSVRGFRKY